MNKQNPSKPRHAKVGLFGGTFDPIHSGHRQVAVDILQQFNLDRIHFIPCALQPHKTDGPLASASNRLNMLKLVLHGHPCFEISEVEIRRQGPSYTIDTLNYFSETQPRGTALHFILGLDAFLEIDTWRSFDKLFDLAIFIVMARPGFGDFTGDALHTAVDFTRHQISLDYRLDDHGDRLSHPVKNPIYLASVRQIDIASSQIRHMIRQGQSIKNLVNPDVANYIEDKGLYR
jgi:nicotinate-nucleotide adenylyltransferase